MEVCQGRRIDFKLRQHDKNTLKQHTTDFGKNEFFMSDKIFMSDKDFQHFVDHDEHDEHSEFHSGFIVLHEMLKMSDFGTLCAVLLAFHHQARLGGYGR